MGVWALSALAPPLLLPPFVQAQTFGDYKEDVTLFHGKQKKAAKQIGFTTEALQRPLLAIRRI